MGSAIYLSIPEEGVGVKKHQACQLRQYITLSTTRGRLAKMTGLS